MQLKCPKCNNDLVFTAKGLKCPYCEKSKRLTVLFKQGLFTSYYKVLEGINMEYVRRNLLTSDEVSQLSSEGVEIKIIYG